MEDEYVPTVVMMPHEVSEIARWHAETWTASDNSAIVLDSCINWHLDAQAVVRVYVLEVTEMAWYRKLWEKAKSAWRWLRWVLVVPPVLGGLWALGRRLFGWGRGGSSTGTTYQPPIDEDRARAEKERIRAHAEAARDEVNKRADDLLEKINEKLGE